MGEVRKRGNIWWIRYYRNGRRHEESSGSTRKGDATKLLKVREGDIAKGIPVSAKAGRLKFDEAVRAVMDDYRNNGRRSLAAVERRYRLHLEPFFGGQKLASLTTADMRAYIAKRRKDGAANATVNRELAVVKRAYSLAEKDGRILHRPHIPSVEEDNVREGFFERDEFEDVRDALPKPLRGLVTFAYLTGWRVPSEVQTLKWAQVDRKAQVIRLEPGKTKNREGRVLPYGLLPELVQVIEEQWAERERLLAESGKLCPWVFHRKGKPVRSFRKAWKAACKAAGCPGKLVHDFRRTAARNLVRAGVPDKIAMGVTGHKTRSVFDRYNIVDESDLRDALGRLSDSTGTEKGQSQESGRVQQIGESS